MIARLRKIGLEGVTVVLNVAALVGLLGAWVLLLNDLRPAPVTYSSALYYTERPTYCPGDTLVYTNTLTITRPGVIAFGSSWFTGTGPQARPAVSGTDIRYQIFDRGGLTFTARRTAVIPALPPGPAEYRFGATALGGQAAIHVVPFEVRSGC